MSKCAHNFSIICLTETWNSDESFLNNSNFQLPNYNSIHFGRKNKRGGGICIFISDSLNFKRINDLSILANETLTIEIINKTTKNIIVSTCYRPAAAKIKQFKQHLAHLFEKLTRENKKLFIVGDFNMNSLNYSTNSKVKKFIDFMFSKGLLSIVNIPIRITKTTISCIDHNTSIHILIKIFYQVL